MEQSGRDAPQLRMVWPTNGRACPLVQPADGYTVRTFRPGDEDAFLSLMAQMDFDPWDAAKLTYNVNRVIPDGWFFITDRSGQMAAAAMCLHNYTGRSPYTGDVGWVACHPDHRGRRLGRCLCSYVTRRFLDAGYTDIQLHTESFRLAAIKTYFDAGYLPSIPSPELASIWEGVCAQLRWPFTPDAWAAHA